MNAKRTIQTSGLKPAAKKATPRKPRASGAKTSAAKKYGELKLASLLRIDGVVALNETLNSLLTDSTKLTIDASAVEKTDTSALQLLTAFSLAAARRNIEIRWHKPSAAFLHAAGLLGLDGTLHLASTPKKQLHRPG